MNQNPIIQMADEIERLTNGLCTVGVGPSGFGVSNENRSFIGMYIREKAEFFPREPEVQACTEGDLYVEAYGKVNNGRVSRGLVEKLLEYSCGKETETVCNAYLKLEGRPIHVTRAQYEEAYAILADKALARTAEQKTEYELRPASEDEAGLFYALPPEQDEALGCIGHVRIDFGKNGKEFWHTWHPRGPEELNSKEFKKELTEVVDELRKTVLKSRTDMSNFCYNNGGQISGGWAQNHGFIIETDSYQYYLRCNPVQGDYNGYLTCFDKQVQEMNQAHTQDQGMAMGGMQL